MEQIKGTSGFDEPATDSSAHAVDDATAQPPFFRLPRELRDKIYDLAVMSEEKFYYDIALRAERPAQKAVYIDRGAHRTFSNSQFETEYSAAAEQRIKSLVTGGDRCGLRLVGPGRPDYRRQAEIKTPQGMVKAEDVWLEISKGPRADGHIGHSIHALVLAIRMTGPQITRLEPAPSVIFKFKFPDKAELGPRLRFDCYWDIEAPTHIHDHLHFPSDDDSVVQQILSISPGVDWKGSFREYMLWHRYIVKYAHSGPSPAFS